MRGCGGAVEASAGLERWRRGGMGAIVGVACGSKLLLFLLFCFLILFVEVLVIALGVCSCGSSIEASIEDARDGVSQSGRTQVRMH